jgi:hypothetical protein
MLVTIKAGINPVNKKNQAKQRHKKKIQSIIDNTLFVLVSFLGGNILLTK